MGQQRGMSSSKGCHHVTSRTRVEEAGSAEIAGRIKGSGRHGTGKLSKVHAITSRSIDAEVVRAHACGKSMVVLGLGSENGVVLQRLGRSVGLMLDEE
jgi:hypothetical protein